MTLLHLVELLAASFGIMGTIMLAMNNQRSGWGFVAFLASNAGWIVFAQAQGHWGLLLQQVCFTATSLLGIWIWLLRPVMRNAQRVIDDLGQGADYFEGVVEKPCACGRTADTATAAAVETLQRLDYTYHGGQLWRPPLGAQPAWVDAVDGQAEHLPLSRPLHGCEGWPSPAPGVMVASETEQVARTLDEAAENAERWAQDIRARAASIRGVREGGNG